MNKKINHRYIYGLTLALGVIVAGEIFAVDTMNYPSQTGLVVNIRLPKSLDLSTRIPLIIEVANHGEKDSVVLEPSVTDEALVNLQLQFFKRKEAKEEEINTRLFGLWRNKREVKISGKSKTVFQIKGFSLQRYFDIERVEVGTYSLRATLSMPNDSKISGTVDFAIESEKGIVRKQIVAPVLSMISGESRLPPAHHSVTLRPIEPKGYKLIYDCDIPLTDETMVIFKGDSVKDLTIIFAERRVNKSERIVYDEQLRLLFSEEKAGTSEENKNSYSLVSHCRYIAVVFLADKSVKFWTIGQYDPLPEWRKDVVRPSLIAPHILSDNKAIAGHVTAIKNVAVKDGLIAISYIQDSVGELTTLVDERGQTIKDPPEALIDNKPKTENISPVEK